MKSFKKVGAYALAIALSASALASNVAYAAGTSKSYEVVESVYVRSGMGSNYSKLGTNYRGSIIDAEREGDWLKFAYNGKTGYSHVSYYKEASSSSYSNYQAVESVYVRSGKGSGYSRLGTVYSGRVVNAVREGDWLKFTYDGQTAYAHVSYFTISNSSSQSYGYYEALESVYVRTGKGSGYSRLGTIYSGDVVDAVREGDWLKFTYGGKTGYSHASFYKQTSSSGQTSSSQSPRNYMANYTVNVRAGKGSDYSILGAIYPEMVINAVREGDWLKFTYNGRTAYTAAAYYQVTNQSVTSGYDKPSIPSTSANSSAGKAAAIVRSKVGYPYYFGAAGPNSFDCSGLTMFAYSSVGVSIPRGAQAQSRIGTTVSYSNMNPGDLIFFGSYEDTYHVAMYVGNGQIVHASTPSTGVIMDSVDNVWIRNNYYTVKRIAN